MPLANFELINILMVKEESGGSLTNHQIGLLEIQGNDTDLNNYVDFNKLKTLGQDFRPLDSDDSTQLSYYIAEWLSGAKTAKIWVKKPTLAASQFEKIFIYGNNAGASDAGNFSNTMEEITDTTTQNCQARYKLNDGTGNNATDSSGNTFTAILNETSNNPPTWVGNGFSLRTHPDGGGFRFAGDHLDFGGAKSSLRPGYNALMKAGTGDYVFETDVDFASLPSSNHAILMSDEGEEGTAAFMQFYIEQTTGKLVLEIEDSTGNNVFVRTQSGIGAGLHRVGFSFIRSSQTVEIFFNGNSVAIDTVSNDTLSGSVDNGAVPMKIGLNDIDPQPGQEPFIGQMDEIVFYNRSMPVGEHEAHYLMRKFATTQPTFFFAPVSGFSFWFPSFSETTKKLINPCLETFNDTRPVKRSQTRSLTAGGVVKVFSNNRSETFLEIKPNSLTQQQKDDLVEFITVSADYTSRSFDVITDQQEIFQSCRFWNPQDTLESFYKQGLFKGNILIRVDPV